jgi:hypothetical protein
MTSLALAAAAQTVVPRVETRAQISVRIINGARITEADWEAATRKTDRLIMDKTGTQIRLRTIDFE